MSCEALKKSARETGDEIHIEIQGSMGIENRLTQDEIDEAELVIFAVNITVENRDRFTNKEPITIDPGEFCGNGAKALQKAKDLAKK